MREPNPPQRRQQAPLVFAVTVLSAALLGAVPMATRARADEPATVPPAAVPPAAQRALDTLTTREMILTSQAGMARVTAHWRARELYRFLRASGDGGDDDDGGITLSETDRARALTTGARALERELHEEQLIKSELANARAEREALVSGAVAAVQPREVGRAPTFRPPVAGPLVSRFGAARDPATGAWLFHSGVRLRARPGDVVRAVAPGLVVRIVAASAQGPAILVDHGGGWTSLLAGVGGLAVVVGERVAAGQAIGRAGASEGIVCEIWRVRTPVDPAAYLRF
jgi:murein DD-endopeptidase MepM/ murein hydrolase activator NlpD